MPTAPESWKVGGAQHLALHAATGRLYSLMHGAASTRHKDPGTEVWVYDVAKHAARAAHRARARPRCRSRDTGCAPLLLATAGRPDAPRSTTRSPVSTGATIEGIGQTHRLLLQTFRERRALTCEGRMRHGDGGSAAAGRRRGARGDAALATSVVVALGRRRRARGRRVRARAPDRRAARARRAGRRALIGGGPEVGEAAPLLRRRGRSAGGSSRIGGERADGAQTLLFFLSPTCPVCKTLLPVARSTRARSGAGSTSCSRATAPRASTRASCASSASRRSLRAVHRARHRRTRSASCPYAVLIDGAGHRARQRPGQHARAPREPVRSAASAASPRSRSSSRRARTRTEVA